MGTLLTFRDQLFAWAVAPLLLLVSIALAIVLRVPQLARLVEGFRALRAHDASAEGVAHPATAVGLSTVLGLGATAAVSAATAVALGGAGALAWLWLFGLVFAPLRYAEAYLARTSPAGKAGKQEGAAARGSLAARMLAEPGAIERGLGWALLVCVPVAGFLAAGGLQGVAIMDLAGAQLEGAAQPLTIAVGVVGIALALAAGAMKERGRALLGWLALAGLVSLLTAALLALLDDPGRGLGGIARAIDDALSGAEPVGTTFSGALASEIAVAALVWMLPPMVLGLGSEGALHAEASASSTKGQAAAAMLASLAHVVLTTLIGLAIIATGAFSRRTDTERALAEVTLVTEGFETTSQRIEPDRAWDGMLRVIDGEPRATPLHLATERGMIAEPRFVEADGSPADFLVDVDEGHIRRMLRPDRDGSLAPVDLDEATRVRVRGRMLPRGGALLTATTQRGGGELLSRLALGALWVLAVLAVVASGLAVSRTLSSRLPEQVARFGAALPSLGVLLAASGAAPWLGAVGAIAAGILAVVVALVLAVKANEMRKV